MSPSPESFGDTGKSRGRETVTGTQRSWFSVLNVYRFNIWLSGLPRLLAVTLSRLLPDKPQPCPEGRVHGDPEWCPAEPQYSEEYSECLDQALSCLSGEGGLLAPSTPWRLCGFISSLLFYNKVLIIKCKLIEHYTESEKPNGCNYISHFHF